VIELEAPGAGHGDNGGVARTQAFHWDGGIAGDWDWGGKDGGRDGQGGDKGDQETPERGFARVFIGLGSELERHRFDFYFLSLIGLINLN
jgi:hypothetical protein